MSCLKQASSESTDTGDNPEEFDSDDQSELHAEAASEAEVAELIQEFEAIKKKAEGTPLHNPLTAYIVQAGETPLLARTEEAQLSQKMVEQRTAWRRIVLCNPHIQHKIIEDMRQIVSGKMFVASYVVIKSPIGETIGRKARIEKRMFELEMLSALSDSLRQRKVHAVLTDGTWEEGVYEQEIQEKIATLLEEIGLEIEPLIVAFNAAKKEHVSKTYTPDERAAFTEKTGAFPEEWEHSIKKASGPFNEWQEARSHIVRANLRLVISIAKKYRNRGKPFLDLIQDGNIGLMRGVDKFNPDLGNRVTTYVTWWIHQKVGRESSNDRRFMRLPEHMKGLAQKILNFEREYAHEHNGGMLHNETIAEHLSETVERIAITRAELHGTLSLDYSIAKDKDSDRSFSLHSLLADSRELPPEIGAENASVRALIRKVLLTFPERQIEIINERFGLGFEIQHINGVTTLHNNPEKYGQEMTLNTISNITSGDNQKAVTRERIRQIETKAINKLLITDGGNPVRAQLQHIASELMDNVHDTPPSKLNGDSPQPEPISSPNPTLDINLAQLSLPLRLHNALEGYGIFTIRDALTCTNADLLGLNGISVASIHLLDEALACVGLERFKGETPLKANKVKKTEEVQL